MTFKSFNNLAQSCSYHFIWCYCLSCSLCSIQTGLLSAFCVHPVLFSFTPFIILSPMPPVILLFPTPRLDHAISPNLFLWNHLLSFKDLGHMKRIFLFSYLIALCLHFSFTFISLSYAFPHYIVSSLREINVVSVSGSWS